MITAALVDTGALAKVIWVSLVAGIGVTVAFSLVVFGLSRGNEARRERAADARLPSRDRGARARRAGRNPLAFYAIAAAGSLLCAWAIWRGYDFVVTKP